MKSNIAQLMEKSENDNQLVSMLRRKLEASNNPYYGKNLQYQQGGVGAGGNAVYNDGMGGYAEPDPYESNNVTVNNAPYNNGTNIGTNGTRGGNNPTSTSSANQKNNLKPKNIHDVDNPDQAGENTRQKQKMMEMKKNLKQKNIYDDSYFEDKKFNAFGPNSNSNGGGNGGDGNSNGNDNNGGNAAEDARVQAEMEELRAQVKRQAAMLQMISKA
jgi:hypothetical protein